jgi:glycerol-3-phosphate dehydrogenase
VDMALSEADAKPPSRTADLPLVGAAPREELARLARELAVEPGLDGRSADSLVARHGTRARDVLALGRRLDLMRPLGDGPHLEAEVAWAVRDELALGLDDVLSRRLRLSMSRRDRAASLAPRAARIMGSELGWDGSREAAEVEAFLDGAHREYDVPGPDVVAAAEVAA